MRILVPTLILALSGCATSIAPVEVTRFHLGQAIPPGPVEVQPVTGSAADSLEFRTYSAAVGRRLGGLGFAEGGASSPYLAEIAFSRGTRTDFNQRPPVTIGVGGGSHGRGLGVGIGTSFGVGGGRKELVLTRLLVKLKTRADGKPVWEGRAETEAKAGTPAAQPGLAAEKLAGALFAGFPGESGKTITVP